VHVASLQRPLVVLFQQQRNGKADDRGVVFREMPSDRSRTRFTNCAISDKRGSFYEGMI